VQSLSLLALEGGNLALDRGAHGALVQGRMEGLGSTGKHVDEKSVVITLGQRQTWQCERKVGEAVRQWKRRKRAQHCSSSLCALSSFNFSFEGALLMVLMLQGGKLFSEPCKEGKTKLHGTLLQFCIFD
jgi:hypothetical protein